jgi:hypothetical protein
MDEKPPFSMNASVSENSASVCREADDQVRRNCAA